MRVAVVDADGIAAHLPAALAAHGLETVRVRSESPDVHLTGSAAADVRHRGDVAVTADALRRRDVGFVLAGTESGVLLADELSAALGTPGNGMTRPRARRDKFEMVTAVREAGLATAASFASPSADEVVAWAVALGTWPVVLKPPASAGSDNVRICGSVDEVRAGHAAILAATTRYGSRNETVLAQEYLHGDEYFVNTVSRDGAHHVVEVWRYHKRALDGGHWMYDYEQPVPLDEPRLSDLAGYTLDVLNALELRNGAGHTEVMLTAAGPVLVESGARMGGSHQPSVVSRCIGTNQVECLALAVARPEEVTERRLPTYRPRSFLRYVTLISPGDGVVPDEAGFAVVRALPSFVDLVLTTPAGRPVGRTVDLATSVGYVYLDSADPEQVESDYKQLREYELNGLYTDEAV
ncbi:ATP-grasp domain-containing protein [Amycolatopsis balhimycina DSM 5908]|uniref:ATP-grasp domain-containing protein n=1 Tax=Amycolatopsis balhimycina DSM 5908 TaxID=1081091 RepID=A0A428X6B8_AMYBA|nr:ATP-grasp domain-containing protein [Amycolatopsis balhimycina]RSM50827.1 ATP-grasp domain-containing protein [Amycolatopsis balhimycina DSM 5908]